MTHVIGWKDVTADVCGGDNRTVLARLVMEGDCLVIASSNHYRAISLETSCIWQECLIAGSGFSFPNPFISICCERFYQIHLFKPYCSGNTDEKFLPLVQARKGKFMDASGTIVMFAVIFSDSDSQIKECMCIWA